MKRLFPVTMMIALAIIIIGCSGSSNDPLGAIPDNNTQEISAPTSHSSRTLWGFWECSLDPGSDAFEIVQLRTAEFTANVNNLLDSKPGNLIIEDIEDSMLFTDGSLSCTVKLRHPFPGLDMYNGFDVLGVFMHNGSAMLDYDDLTYADGESDDEAVLLNSDGYTRWFNYPEFNGGSIPLMEFWPGKLGSLPDPTATLNPFKIYADGLDVEDDYHAWISEPSNSADRGIFRAGEVNGRRYEMRFPLVGPLPVVKFQYAVVATWEEGDPELTGNPSLFEPTDFPTSANCEEAFFINADTSESDLFYVDPASLGGTFRADVEVFDWQGGYGGNGVTNEINRILIEGDFIPGGQYEWSQAELSAVEMPGTENSSVYQVEIPGCAPTASGDTELWMIVEAMGINGESYDQGFPTSYPLGANRAAFGTGSVFVTDEALNFEVTAIDPDTTPFWSIVDDATISGNNFQSGANVELRMTGEDAVIGTDVQFVSSSELTCDFDLTDVQSGDWDVVVINPGDVEAMLAGGFTIEEWSEEITLEEDGNRLPQLAETSEGSAVLLVSCNDNNLMYNGFDAGTGWWSQFYTAVSGNSGHFLMSMTSSPANDSVYLAVNLNTYRYTGGTSTWDYQHTQFGSARAVAIHGDINNKIHIYHNTNSAFGWIIHNRRAGWGMGYEQTYDYFQDSWNTDVISEANIFTVNSSGRTFIAYERDYNLSPYTSQTDPRWVKCAWHDPNGLVQYNLSIVDVATNLNPLDSPSITCDSNDDLHYAYRRWQAGSSEWQVVYKKSSNDAITWDSESIVYQGAEEPEDGFLYIMADSNDNLHVVYNLEGDIQYKSSTDGITWSDPETVSPTADGLPSGTEDITPRMLVTADGIMHVVWIRDDSATGYGDIYHRMRDLY